MSWNHGIPWFHQYRDVMKSWYFMISWYLDIVISRYWWYRDDVMICHDIMMSRMVSILEHLVMSFWRGNFMVLRMSKIRGQKSKCLRRQKRRIPLSSKIDVFERYFWCQEYVDIWDVMIWSILMSCFDGMLRWFQMM